MEQFDCALSLEQNIADNILRTDSFLFGEPDSYLQQELRDPSMYNAVVRAVVSGIGKPAEIADAAGVDSAALAGYLKSLMELGIVQKEQPVIDANRKKVRYRIADHLFRLDVYKRQALAGVIARVVQVVRSRARESGRGAGWRFLAFSGVANTALDVFVHARQAGFLPAARALGERRGPAPVPHVSRR